MESIENRQFKLKTRPVGLVKRDDFEFATAQVGEPGDGEVLVEVQYISLDPAMRGWMNDAKSYMPPVGIGEVMRAGGIGKVIVSNAPNLAVGDFVTGMTGVQAYVIANGGLMRKVDPEAAPLPRYLGALGMPGLTAYFGLLDICEPKEGETVVVSGAAGAVGSVVGQIAKIIGCKVVGIAGGPEKCRYLTDELGLDAAIDYKNDDVQQGLREHCPKGVDVYFDNVGGDILDLVMEQLARKARISICGAISQYNNVGEAQGPKNYLSLLVFHARMEGFVVTDYINRADEGLAALRGWIGEGQLVAREDIVKGIETFPETFLRLFSGENFGKLVLQVSDE